MREVSRFQLNVSRASKQIQEFARTVDGNASQAVFEKWKKSQQEPYRIAAALFCWSRKTDLSFEEKEVLGRYLKQRVRNAVEALIEENDAVGIQDFSHREWFGLTELNGFLETAVERGKHQALIILLMIKDTKYGYQEETYEL